MFRTSSRCRQITLSAFSYVMHSVCALYMEDVMRDDLNGGVKSDIEGTAVQHLACRRETYANTPVMSAADDKIRE